ncbi:RNA polymerase subunit sigma-70 [Flavobacterium album]|uniref:RNA polymerase subunit sigma-70 n=1 Tax=Flavobacterium album TaxID=2175091 RepID=A0A2S1R145_9FLAO|nr:sigma-70 family RNA polymerase sigma factor [Flavobacterium album]AWH86400.1 RNA polymerase subunit sigma-70 [Flavobacterium album]
MVENKTIDSDSRKARLEALYIKAFPLVARYVAKMGGTRDEAKDIFHDALLLYMEKEYSTGINLQYSEASYILGIARHLWAKRGTASAHTIEELAITHDDQHYTEVASLRLSGLLAKGGRKCLELLSAFYYEKLDMESLAQRFGFAGARSATVQKFKCLEKVKDVVKAKSLQYEDFME